jgi:hypothetical protein
MLLAQSIRDYLSPKMLGISFVPLLVPLVLFFVLLSVGGAQLLEAMQAGAASGDFGFLEESAHPWLAKALEFSIIQWIAVALFYLLGGALSVLASVMIALIVIGFLTPMIVRWLHGKHFSHITLSRGVSLGAVLREALGIVGKFLVFGLLCLPLLLIPIVNVIALHLPFYYLFYRLLILDVGTTLLSKPAYVKFKKEHQRALMWVCLVCFVLSLVPFVGLFLQPLFVIYLSHYVFQKVLLQA